MDGKGPYGPLWSLAKGMLIESMAQADGVPGFCENPSNSPRRVEGKGAERRRDTLGTYPTRYRLYVFRYRCAVDFGRTRTPRLQVLKSGREGPAVL